MIITARFCVNLKVHQAKYYYYKIKLIQILNYLKQNQWLLVFYYNCLLFEILSINLEYLKDKRKG
jgi:hypothetical protein